MNSINIVNAQIVKTQITMEDHGCLTFWITLKGDNWCSSLGGYCIGKGYLGAKNFTAETGNGLEAMMHIMNTVSVSTWEDLIDKFVRVKTDDFTIKAIGNLIEDKWFDIEDFFSKKQKE